MSRHLVAIDQGTTSTKVTILDESLAVLGTTAVEFAQHYPQPGWVEHDLSEIWISTIRAMEGALRDAAVDPNTIAAIGITNQRETTALWERDTGRALGRAIVWQCRRTADRCHELRQQGHSDLIKKRTGLVIDAYFSGTKVEWLLDHHEGARARAEAGELAFGTIDSFLVWHLTGGAAHVTDVSNASRTMLMGLESLEWDPELCDLLRVPRPLLPEIRGSAEVYGTTKDVPGLPDGIPIAGMAGDQQAALFGQACFAAGQAKITYGTGAFLLVNTGSEIVESNHGMLTTVAWKLGDEVTYALEGSAFVAGAAVQWLRDSLGMIRTAPEIEALARLVEDSAGVVFVPAFVGLGAPHWVEDARGAILNLTRGATKNHIARACLEGIAHQNADILSAMEADRGQPLAELRVDGGASANDLLMQLQADLAGLEVTRPTLVETTSIGAAFLAGLGSGVWSDLDALAAVWSTDRVFAPVLGSEAREAERAKWSAAIEGVSTAIPKS